MGVSEVIHLAVGIFGTQSLFAKIQQRNSCGENERH